MKWCISSWPMRRIHNDATVCIRISSNRLAVTLRGVRRTGLYALYGEPLGERRSMFDRYGIAIIGSEAPVYAEYLQAVGIPVTCYGKTIVIDQCSRDLDAARLAMSEVYDG